MQTLILASSTNAQLAAQAMRSTAEGTSPTFVFWTFVVFVALVLLGLAVTGGPRRRSIDEEWNNRR